MISQVDFAVVLMVQAAVLAVVLVRNRARFGLLEIARIAAAAVVFGVAFDCVFGYLLGVFGYTLGFGWAFLFVNGFLSYGLFFATVAALRNAKLLSFYAWSVIIGAAYELANAFFPVWHWSFAGSRAYEELIVIFVAYCGLALLSAGTLWLFGCRFRLSS
jgi:hypothetical protein